MSTLRGKNLEKKRVPNETEGEKRGTGKLKGLGK